MRQKLDHLSGPHGPEFGRVEDAKLPDLGAEGAVVGEADVIDARTGRQGVIGKKFRVAEKTRVDHVP